MADDPDFADLVNRLRAQDEAAAALVFRQFGQRLAALARSRLDRLTRQKVDPEDVVQSVFRSFFRRQGHGQFELAQWDNLWSILSIIAVRKCANRVVHYRQNCRNVNQEIVSEPEQGRALSREPTPEDAAALEETVEHLLAKLDERKRQMVALALQGGTTEEISAAVGRTRRTVERVLREVREFLLEAAESSSNP